MRTTVTLDDDVLEAARAQAKASGKTLGQVLSHLARRGLRPSEQAVESTGLPVFKVTADSGIIPSSQARELLAEDGDVATPFRTCGTSRWVGSTPVLTSGSASPRFRAST